MEGISVSNPLTPMPIPHLIIRPRRAKVVLYNEELLLVEIVDEASTDDLVLLLGSFGIKPSVVSELKPCFDLDEMRKRNATLTR